MTAIQLKLTPFQIAILSSLSSDTYSSQEWVWTLTQERFRDVLNLGDEIPSQLRHLEHMGAVVSQRVVQRGYEPKLIYRLRTVGELQVKGLIKGGF